jgi:hypothetical protein
MEELVEFADDNIEPVELQYPDFQVFATGCEHSYRCRCTLCRHWWLSVGPEDDGKFGPFGLELWEDYAAKHDKTVEQAKLHLAAGQLMFGDVNIFPDLFSDEQLEEYFREMLMPEEENENGD